MSIKFNFKNQKEYNTIPYNQLNITKDHVPVVFYKLAGFESLKSGLKYAKDNNINIDKSLKNARLKIRDFVNKLISKVVLFFFKTSIIIICDTSVLFIIGKKLSM